MNYYQPNLYGNYPYNQYGQYGQAQHAMMPQPPQQTYNTLQGKVVDNLETAKVTDIPFGGYGVFPKADMSEIYIKTWTNNGTTSMITYKPDKEEKMEEDKGLNTELILTRIKEIEEKIDSILLQKTTVVPQKQINTTITTNQSAAPQRKELNTNVY